MDDIIIAKTASLNDCLKRINEDYQSRNDFYNSRTKQDAIILNLLRACETIIDMANHTIRLKKLGFPKVTREAFVLLEKSKIISPELSTSMQNMVGFRNVTIHDYEIIDLDIVQNILDHHLDDLKTFAAIMAAL